MQTVIRSLFVAVVLAGCAAQQPAASQSSAAQTPPVAQTPTTAQTPAAAQNTYTGEVWTWDEQANTVTLRQGERTVRLKVTPEQIRGLKLYQVVTLRGEPAAAEIERITLPGGTLVPRGDAEDIELTGTVEKVDPAGTVSVTTPRGPVSVWVATPGSTPFKAGDQVKVRVRVQPLELVAAKDGQAAPPDVAASVATEPGEYAVVRGPITAVDPSGRLTVESPRGPVTVLVPNSQRYRSGNAVEVRTSVHPAP